MDDDISMFKALSVWQAEAREGVAGDASGEHLGAESLYKLAVPGGLAKADESVVEHLSLCPICQREWVSWLESLEMLSADSEEEEGKETVLAAGFLKAAAASLFSEPVTLESSCSGFELSVFPEVDKPSRALITLEVKTGSDMYENRYCTVRDGKGAVLLSGSLEDGRLAGRVEDIALIDLKTWTVIVGGD